MSELVNVIGLAVGLVAVREAVASAMDVGVTVEGLLVLHAGWVLLWEIGRDECAKGEVYG